VTIKSETIILLLGCLTISIFLTFALRRIAIAKHIMDIPNDRSSHSVATPRGGGLSFVITFCFALIVLVFMNSIQWNSAMYILMAGGLVAMVGFIDDRGHINASLRLLFHFTGAVLIVYAGNGLPNLNVFGHVLNFSDWGWLIAVLGCVWMLNIYNFMDGIDGLASIEAVSSTLIMGMILLFVFNQPSLALLHFSLTASVLGFLLFNFPPAKIFMGDAGSGFLGIITFALLLLSARISETLFWSWSIILGVFIVDATYTLIRRLIRGEKPHHAHRSHSYQFAARKYDSHRKVTITIFLINLLWLSPLALLVATHRLDGSMGLVIAYIPLLTAAIYFKAGEPA
jgi:Fuc2NAc and GlcNAc transferase